MKHSPLLTRRELATALHVHQQTVVKWAQQGMPLAARGRRGRAALYSLPAVLEWRQRTEAARQTGAEVVSLSAARARLAKAQAEKWERENRKRTGELIERAVVVREGQNMIFAAKTKLLQVPRQCVLRGVPRDAEAVIRQHIVEALRELANRWKTLERRGPDSEVIHG